MNTIKEKAPTAAAIREISVSRVAFQPPPKKRKNAGDDADTAGWYKVAYSTFITMPDGRRKEIKTFTTKGMANHSTDMMKKTRDAIYSHSETTFVNS